MPKILRGIDPLNMNVSFTADVKFEVMFQVCLILLCFVCHNSSTECTLITASSALFQYMCVLCSSQRFWPSVLAIIRSLTYQNIHDAKPTKFTNLFHRYLYCIFTLNSPTCFDLQGIIIREKDKVIQHKTKLVTFVHS